MASQRRLNYATDRGTGRSNFSIPEKNRISCWSLFSSFHLAKFDSTEFLHLKQCLPSWCLQEKCPPGACRKRATRNIDHPINCMFGPARWKQTSLICQDSSMQTRICYQPLWEAVVTGLYKKGKMGGVCCMKGQPLVQDLRAMYNWEHVCIFKIASVLQVVQPTSFNQTQNSVTPTLVLEKSFSSPISIFIRPYSGTSDSVHPSNKFLFSYKHTCYSPRNMCMFAVAGMYLQTDNSVSSNTRALSITESTCQE